jgi:uncharacterized coiled-coil protein SlyX
VPERVRGSALRDLTAALGVVSQLEAEVAHQRRTVAQLRDTVAVARAEADAARAESGALRGTVAQLLAERRGLAESWRREVGGRAKEIDEVRAQLVRCVAGSGCRGGIGCRGWIGLSWLDRVGRGIAPLMCSVLLLLLLLAGVWFLFSLFMIGLLVSMG